jgi:hypothetical protein
MKGSPVRVRASALSKMAAIDAVFVGRDCRSAPVEADWKPNSRAGPRRLSAAPQRRSPARCARAIRALGNPARLGRRRTGARARIVRLGLAGGWVTLLLDDGPVAHGTIESGVGRGTA